MSNKAPGPALLLLAARCPHTGPEILDGKRAGTRARLSTGHSAGPQRFRSFGNCPPRSPSLIHNHRRLWGLQAASHLQKQKPKLTGGEQGKGSAPELQGERQLWLPSAVSKMFGEHALLARRPPSQLGRVGPPLSRWEPAARPSCRGHERCQAPPAHPDPRLPPSDLVILGQIGDRTRSTLPLPGSLTGSGEPTPQRW